VAHAAAVKYAATAGRQELKANACDEFICYPL
jgi:hypothetical protein